MEEVTPLPNEFYPPEGGGFKPELVFDKKKSIMLGFLGAIPVSQNTSYRRGKSLHEAHGARSSPSAKRQHIVEKHYVMTTIRVKENEPFDVALRRFKRTIEKLGLLTDLRAREFYEKPTAERKRKKAAAVKRNYKRIRSMQLPKKMY